MIPNHSAVAFAIARAKSFLMRFLFVFLLAATALVRAQDNPLNDPDYQRMSKQTGEAQKSSTPVDMSELRKQGAAAQVEAAKEAARFEEKENLNKAAMRAKLEKQMENAPATLPDWTPATPQFKSAGAPVKKIDNDQVKIVQTGTSPLTPTELGDACEAALAGKKINHIRNNNSSNGAKSVILFLTLPDNADEEVRLEADRDADGKITTVKISLALATPDDK